MAVIAAETQPDIPDGYNPYFERIVMEEKSHIHGLHLQPDQRDVLEKSLGYQFRSADLLAEALTHSSRKHCRSNERLKFLGEAVLDVTIMHLLSEESFNLDTVVLDNAQKIVTRNSILARFTVKHKLYLYLFMSSRHRWQSLRHCL
jgi:dsRNA-specific ribonuclease